MNNVYFKKLEMGPDSDFTSLMVGYVDLFLKEHPSEKLVEIAMVPWVTNNEDSLLVMLVTDERNIISSKVIATNYHSPLSVGARIRNFFRRLRGFRNIKISKN